LDLDSSGPYSQLNKVCMEKIIMKTCSPKSLSYLDNLAKFVGTYISTCGSTKILCLLTLSFHVYKISLKHFTQPIGKPNQKKKLIVGNLVLCCLVQEMEEINN